MEITKIEAASEFDLFGVTEFCQIVGDKRTATDDECRAYARWLAMRAGIVEAVTNSPKLEWKIIDRRNSVCIGAYFGDVFVAFPGADQSGAVTFELLDESGNVETSGTIYAKPNGALNIADADATAMKESAKAWGKANKGKAKAKPIAAPISEAERTANSIALGEQMAAAMNDYRLANPLPPIAEPAPDATLSDELDVPESATQTPQDDAPATTLAGQSEIEPQDEKNGLADDIEAQPDAMAALIARMDALEASLASVSSKASSESTPPIAAIETDAPLSGELKPRRSPAHVRAIMAYLAMRKQRRIFRDAADQMMVQRDNLQGMLKTTEAQSRVFYDKKREYYAEWKAEELRLQDMTAKRRRAILKALTLRSNLRLSRDIASDRLSQIVEISQSRLTVSQELASLKAKIADPSNPARESDLVMLKGNAEQWQAKAERAIAESERLKRLAVQNAGHIKTLASRVARAEAMLRDGAPLPVLTLVPPTASVAA